MKVDGCKNFCRVFELPDKYPSAFCFSGGVDVTLQIVDWFNPVMEDDARSWTDIKDSLVDFLQCKPYVIVGKKYLVLTDFDEAFVFTACE